MELTPLKHSYAQNEIEAELKQLFLDLYDQFLAASVHDVNVLGAPHLGSFDLMRKSVNNDGLVLLQGDREEDATRYLYRAWKSRNDQGRGLAFLETYLQMLFPNQCEVTQLYHDRNFAYPTACYTGKPSLTWWIHQLGEPGLKVDGTWGLGRRITPDDPNRRFRVADTSNMYLTSRVDITLDFAVNVRSVANIMTIIRSIVPARILPVFKFVLNVVTDLLIRVESSLEMTKRVPIRYPWCGRVVTSDPIGLWKVNGSIKLKSCRVVSNTEVKSISDTWAWRTETLMLNADTSHRLTLSGLWTVGGTARQHSIDIIKFNANTPTPTPTPTPSEILLTMPFTVDSQVTEFGNGLAKSGDGSRTVVGAAYQNTPTNQMEAPVFVYLNGVLEAILNPDYANTNHANNGGTAFGRGSVSISNAGDVIAIGAPSYDANPNGAAYDGIDNWNYNNGALYIFRRSGVTWSQEAFFPSDGSNNDQLGRAVAISGDGTHIAIVSEYRLLVYKYDTGAWSLEFSTECPATTAYSGYKYCVAISGDGSTVVTSDKGGAYLYVYRRTGSTWTATPEIISGFSQVERASELGISANGNIIVAGVPYESIGESWSVGIACIFEHNGTTWGTPTVLTGDINITDGYFGEGVGVSGDGSTVGIAYPGYAGTFEQQGGIQMFRKVSNVWTLVYTHVLANPLEWDNLGYFMALSNDGLHAAAWLATNPSTANVGEVSGKVYLFSENP